MSDLLHLLQYAVSGAFVVLGLFTLFEWLRSRERGRGYLAIAIASLGLTALLDQLQGFVGHSPWVLDLVLMAFLASGFAVLLFRGEFIPLDPRLRLGALAACILTLLLAVAVNLPSEPNVKPSLVQSLTGFLIAGVWCVCVGEPIARFWISAGGRPRVQKNRLRALSLGFAGIIAILIVDVVAGTAVQNQSAQVVLQLVALATAPLLYASFSPPTWLRRSWREREEAQLRTAIQQLLLFSPTRAVLAERALEWATRLVGADAAAILDADGSTLASRGIPGEDLRRLVDQVPSGLGDIPFRVPGPQHQTLLCLDLRLSNGTGSLVILSGPFTPVFGTDEIDRLRDYSAAISAGLDRVVLTERLAALERTKSQFLNLASHELRGPVTVLRGYLSMLERGALRKAEMKTIMPVLLAKTEEMNLMVEQMIEASRLEEGRLELRRKRVDLRDVVERSVSLMLPLADDEHPISLDCPQVAVPVEVDPDRFGTILNNLLDNALKYSPGGGEVRCQVARNGKMATVAVKDEGIGIAEAQLPQLFTRFGRIVTPETSNIRGTGLGLYLARELARMHGGDITVESEPGQGSTFVMAVPVAG